MRDAIRAEFRKLRTTRSAFGLLVGMVLLSGLAIWGTVASASPAEIATGLMRPEVLFGAVIAIPLFAAVLGIRSFTDEYRYGSIVPTFLATPDRRRVLVAKTVTAAVTAAAFAAVTMGVGIAVALALLSTHGIAGTVAWGTVAGLVGKVIVLAALWSAIGVGVGAVIRHQVAAIVGTLAWMLIAESVVVGIVPGPGRWLPGRAAAIGLGLESGVIALAPVVAFVGWTAAVLALAAATLRRDVV
jgi:ABC-type transport system involved in multi-copper enzyme maturation permease subunit